MGCRNVLVKRVAGRHGRVLAGVDLRQGLC